MKSIPFTSVSSYVAKLLPLLYNEETLMNHTLDGRKPSVEGKPHRPGLPQFHKKEIHSKCAAIRKTICSFVMIIHFTLRSCAA
jgi:hypothetical protein